MTSPVLSVCNLDFQKMRLIDQSLRLINHETKGVFVAQERERFFGNAPNYSFWGWSTLAQEKRPKREKKGSCAVDHVNVVDAGGYGWNTRFRPIDHGDGTAWFWLKVEIGLLCSRRPFLSGIRFLLHAIGVLTGFAHLLFPSSGLQHWPPALAVKGLFVCWLVGCLFVGCLLVGCLIHHLFVLLFRLSIYYLFTYL